MKDFLSLSSTSRMMGCSITSQCSANKVKIATKKQTPYFWNTIDFRRRKFKSSEDNAMGEWPLGTKKRTSPLSPLRRPTLGQGGGEWMEWMGGESGGLREDNAKGEWPTPRSRWVTRGRRRVVIVGSFQELGRAVKRKPIKRPACPAWWPRIPNALAERMGESLRHLYAFFNAVDEGESMEEGAAWRDNDRLEPFMGIFN